MVARQGRHDARPLIALVALVLVPGLALAVLGLRGLGEREVGLRAQYAATSTLLRDRLVSELDRQEQELTRRFEGVDRERADSDEPAALMRRLSALTADQAWLNRPFVMGRDRLATASVHTGWRTRPDDPLAAFPRAVAIVAAAEMAEHVRGDRETALHHYRDALEAVSAAPRASAFLLTRIGRTLLNLNRSGEAIDAYREVLAASQPALDQNGLPFAVIALVQIADAATMLGRKQEKTQAEHQLLQYVVDHPWDLSDGFAVYLNRALASGPAETPTAARGRALANAVADADWLRRDVEPRLRAAVGRSPDERAGHLAIARGGTSVLIGYRAIPRTADDPVVVGYEVKPEFLQGSALETVIGSLSLGRQVKVAVTGRVPADVPRPAASRAHEPLAELPLFSDVLGWTMSIADSEGRSIGQLVARERWAYGVPVLGMVAVMIVGVVLIARTSARATELSRLRTEFVANVSHELKTPLALIRMFGETLESGIVVDEVKRREFYGVIRRESERLTQLVNNVLDLGRIEAGSKRYRLVQTDVVETVREALAAYGPLFERLGFQVETALPDRSIDLPLDRDAIVQALVNLFQNVIKYSGERCYIRVAVTVDDDLASISVADHGVGIAADDLPRIFEPYFRAAAGGAVTSSGSGLGLSIVRHAASAHGGRVDVVSTPGQGSVFTLVLPMTGAAALLARPGQTGVIAEA